MSPEKDDQLCRECPNLYADRQASMTTTCMCWGFDVGDGWFNIVYELSKKLEALIVALPDDQRELTRASQVKEKFGGLRFYMTSSTDEMDRLIDDAETECYKTCEKCGAPGKPRKGGWISTLCDAHDEERIVRKPA